MDFVYRKAESSDSPRIAELFEEMLRTIYHTNDVKGYEDGYLDRFFSEGGDLIYVAELGKEVVAFLSIEVYREDGYIYLDDFSVTAACRNKGIGSKLISLAEDYAESTGIPAIVLHVEKANKRAHELYRKCGYSDYEDQGKRIMMVKELRK
jgi:ribosomal protein S18 acetylase RimI-like enzyme